MPKLSDTDLIDFYESNLCYHGVNSHGEHIVHLHMAEGPSFKGSSFRAAISAAIKGMKSDRERKSA
jgi:hypothetical protein